MPGINFKKKSNLTDFEICEGFINQSPSVLTRFYREQRLMFKNGLEKKIEKSSYGIYTIDDVYNVSFSRLNCMFLKKQIRLEGEKIMYNNNELSCKIGVFLQQIGKYVLLEMMRREAKEQEKKELGVETIYNSDREKEIDAIIVWKIVERMEEPCNTILGQTLTKHLTGKTDSEIAKELNYDSPEKVKIKRLDCKKKFKKAFLAEKKKYIS